MKKIILSVFLSGIVLTSTAQKKTDTTAASATKPVTGGASASKSGPKPYKEVITEKAVSQTGLFTVHKVEEKYFFEIYDSILGREIIAATRYIKVPANKGVGRATYGGELTNQQSIAFEKGPYNNVFMRVITLVSLADTTNAIFRAVSNSNLNTIAAAFPIAAYGKDSQSIVIDVTDFFKGDNQVVSINPNAKRSFNLSAISSDRSYIESINSYPMNTEIRTVKTFSASPPSRTAAPSPFPTSSVPAAEAAGAITIELNTSMILLPKVPMDIRYWDKRVGFFPEDFTEFKDNQQRVEQSVIAVRWRLEPKPEDLEKWKRGELVEPQKPIVYYIDPATPAKWRKYLILGINDWQVAFEKAGFKNAIIGKEWPENDAGMSMEDARFSVLRYFASDVENAYGPNLHDPRSGEILESHIGWYHNVMKLLHDWFLIQTGAVNPRARSMEIDDDLMGELIRFVSSHEVGHTIGLLHNMGSSSKTPVEKLRDKAWVEANGHTASIMDYARFNYVAQPEDNISDIGLFPRIGDYDKWAIRWGYGYISGTTEIEKKEASNKLIIETLKSNPRTWFGTYEFGNDSDPRSQREDLGDNAMKASEYGIKNLKFILKNIGSWTKDETDLNKNLSEMYGQLVTQFRRYMGHVTTYVGGVYETFSTSVQAEPVYEVTPVTLQRQAMQFLHGHLFETPTWIINKDYWNRISNPGAPDPVMTAQESTLNNLLSTDRLNRLQVSDERFGDAVSYNSIEMMNDLQNGLFSELKTKRAIDYYRRALQKSYIEKLTAFISNDKSGNSPVNSRLIRSDIPSIARGQLLKLRSEINVAIPTTKDNMSRLHLLDLQARIKDALDPK